MRAAARDRIGHGRADFFPAGAGPRRERLLAGPGLPGLLDPSEKFLGEAAVQPVELSENLRRRAAHRRPQRIQDRPSADRLDRRETTDDEAVAGNRSHGLRELELDSSGLASPQDPAIQDARDGSGLGRIVMKGKTVAALDGGSAAQ